MKYGRAIKATPIRSMRSMFETKYGNTHSTTPDISAIPLCCLLPYIKYPIPIEPNITPHIIDVVSIVIEFITSNDGRQVWTGSLAQRKCHPGNVIMPC